MSDGIDRISSAHLAAHISANDSLRLDFADRHAGDEHGQQPIGAELGFGLKLTAKPFTGF